jgi:hypothetical protein
MESLQRFFSNLLVIFVRAISLLIGIITGLFISLTIIGYIISLNATQDNVVHWLMNSNFPKNSKVLVADIALSLASGKNLTEYRDIIYTDQFRDWERLIVDATPEDWFEQEVNVLVNKLLIWLVSNPTSTPILQLNLVPVKELLKSPEAVQVMIPFLQYLPVCRDDPPLFGGELLSCLPPRSDWTALARYQAYAIDSFLPEKVTLDSLHEAGFLGMEPAQIFISVHSYVHLFSRLKRLLLSWSLFLLCIYGLLNSSSLKKLSKSMKIPFFISGGVLLIFFLAAQSTNHFLFSSVIQQYLAGARWEFQNLIIEAVNATANLLASSLLIAGFFCIVVGFIAHFIAIKLDRFEGKKSEKNALATGYRLPTRKVYR